MARALRVEYPGAIYHVTGRMVGSWGDERLRLFRDTRDFQRFLDRLDAGVEEHGVRLYLFCLMANHFHLLLETPGGNLSRFMQKLTTSYAVYFNLRHRRHGHLFDGRFKAKVVDGDDYLLKLSRYVHLNPVFVGEWTRRSVSERIDYLRSYRWSSYSDYIGGRARWKFLEMGPVLAHVGGRVKGRAGRYREFVETGLAEDDQEMREIVEASPLCIGGENFRQWVGGLHQKLMAGRECSEDISFRRTMGALEPERVLMVVGEELGVEVESFRERRRNSPLRALAAKFLQRYGGQTQRDVARLLGMSSGSAVCVQARNFDQWVAEDRRLARLVGRIERRLDQARKARR
jgi:putative transposase